MYVRPGFPADAVPAVTSSRSRHVTAVPNRHSPRYYGGGSVGDGGGGGGSGGMRKTLPSRYREASPLKQRPAEYSYSTSAPPLRRAGGHHPKVYGYEDRESPREVTPAAENYGRYDM